MRLAAILAAATVTAVGTLGVSTAVQSHAPLGTRLQREAGDRYEVIYSPTSKTFSVEPRPCEEDQPCWDWRTMGNKAHGVCHEHHLYIEYADGNLDATNDNC